MVENIVCQVEADVNVVGDRVGANNQCTNNNWHTSLDQRIGVINVYCTNWTRSAQAMMDTVKIFPQVRDFLAKK